MGLVIETCAKCPGGPTRITVADVNEEALRLPNMFYRSAGYAPPA